MESWPTSAAVQSWAVFRTPWHVNFPCVFWNRIIVALEEPYFPESITPELLKVWRWSLFSKCSKFYVDLKNAIITQENIFGFEGKCVGTC